MASPRLNAAKLRAAQLRQLAGRIASQLSDRLRQQFTAASRRTRWLALGSGLLLALGGGYAYFATGSDANAAGDGKGPGGERRRGERPGGGRIQPVKAATVRTGDLEVVVTALGTVTASNTATVKARVDGQLVKINFRETQLVKTGDVLAEIDPRPFQIQLDQVRGQLLKDQALLSAAQVDLDRYRALLAKDSIARQQVDTQEALVRQYQGVVDADKAQEANARLQLGFTRITAPAPGRLGLRQVDVGNMLRSSDSTGLVVITQTQPIHVVFAIPADSIASVVPQQQKGTPLKLEIWNSDGKILLGEGHLISIDNQIDVATSTVKLKAEFANRDNTLFPNQFVNVRLKVDQRRHSLLLPTAAIQRNPQGPFVYRIDEERTVNPRPVRLGPTGNDQVIIEDGLQAGDLVVLDGADRLRPGAKVDLINVDGKARDEGETGKDGKDGRRRRGERGGDKAGGERNGERSSNDKGSR